MPILSSDGPEPHDEEHPDFNKGWKPPSMKRLDDQAQEAERAAAFAAGRRAGLLEAAQVCEDPTLSPFAGRSVLGGDTIPFVMRNHLADAIRALAAETEQAA